MGLLASKSTGRELVLATSTAASAALGPISCPIETQFLSPSRRRLIIVELRRKFCGTEKKIELKKDANYGTELLEHEGNQTILT